MVEMREHARMESAKCLYRSVARGRGSDWAGECNLERTCLTHAGINIINIGKTYEKIVLAARILATIQNPEDICVISARPYGHRAVLKFASFCKAMPIAGRFTPGNFTNYITKSFKEPRVIVVTDPRVDHQAIREAAYVNIP